MEEIFLLKLGELVLKGLNRRSFENKLISNLNRKLKPLGSFKIYTMQSAVYVEPQNFACDLDAAFALLTKTFGAVSVSRAIGCKKNLNDIEHAACQYLRNPLEIAESFKVESKRADKSFHLTSPEISREVGAAIIEAYPHLSVDVHEPEVTVYVEIRDYLAYVHAGGTPGAGGLPLGSAGKAVSLLSGGIDSPVATWMIAKRGVSIIPVHFYSFPYTSELAKQKVLDIAKILLPYCEKLTVELVPFTRIQEEIHKKCPEPYFTLLMRRFMMRIADKIARYNGCKALVTGENLGQVASQTMEALAVTEDCSSMPVLRPLIGLDKEEIVRVARRLGTFETSVLPYEDCCTVFTPKHPKTKPVTAEVRELEKVLDIDSLIDDAIQNIEKVRIEI